ncbi:MAG: hypothetical protein HKN03_15595 [Acidimicrobiales bacterium]|nr:hypothetical protein [Acidimicrobiales bacterium]
MGIDWSRISRFAVPAITVWSLTVWASRIRNILADDLEGTDRLWRLGLASLFVVVSLWVFRSAFGLWRDGASDWWSCVSGAALTLALINMVVWPVRAYQILAGDWSGGFKAVHSLLAVISVALGLLVAFQRYGRAGNRRSVRNSQSVAGQV